MSASLLATGQFIAASQALTQSIQAVQSAASIIERSYPTADLNAPMIDRVHGDIAAIRALADRLEAALAAQPSHLREAA